VLGSIALCWVDDTHAHTHTHFIIIITEMQNKTLVAIFVETNSSLGLRSSLKDKESLHSCQYEDIAFISSRKTEVVIEVRDVQESFELLGCIKTDRSNAETLELNIG
jgi:hypothetical protein